MNEHLTMYDDTNLGLIPRDAQAVAGYVNGRFATFTEVVRRWPNAHRLSIAVTSHADADCLDVEPGDATNTVAAGWVQRQHARGLKRPVVYTSVSNAAALLAALHAAGIERHDIRLWTAHYTFREHLCGPRCGFGMPTDADATQWTDRAEGRSLDQSACRPDFFGAVHPDPTPAPGPPSDAGVSALEWSWRQWAFGEGKFKGHAPFAGKRPGGVPNPVPVEWHVRAIEFLIAREHKAT